MTTLHLVKIVYNRIEINWISSEVCPSSHPHPYDYYGDNDYCCPHDPAQNPDTDFCVDDSNEMIGQACPNPPCESHPSVVDGGKGKRFIKIKLGRAHSYWEILNNIQTVL